MAPNSFGVPREKIQEDLERLLASAQFHSSRKCTRFLRHCVEACSIINLRLKERTIGVDVFERDALYDTNPGPYCARQAGEVRKRWRSTISHRIKLMRFVSACPQVLTFGD